MIEYYMGWDVGAWHCDRKASKGGDASRDALCILKISNDQGLEVVGRPFWGNLKNLLNQNLSPYELINQLFRECKAELTTPSTIYLAVDTPLGWPQPMIGLVSTKPKLIHVPEKAGENRYLFRQTETKLFSSGITPLSSVMHQIGAQSTKGLHLKAMLGESLSKTGASWKYRLGEDLELELIETYPAPCKKHAPDQIDPVIHSFRFGQFAGQGSSDKIDAAWCAVIAWLYSTKPETLEAPAGIELGNEGWIWLPKVVYLSKKRKSEKPINQ